MKCTEQLFTSKDNTGLYRILGEAINPEDVEKTVVVYKDVNDQGGSNSYMTKDEFKNTFKEVE